MDPAAYASFLTFALLLVLVPGADFTVVLRNTLIGGRARGDWSATGVACSNAVQGLAAVAGLGAIIVHVQPLFQAITWAGIAYLTYLAAQALRSAWRGHYPPPGAAPAGAGWRQGFLSNITNPKVLVFYLAVLPQFVAPEAPVAVLLTFALSHALLSWTYLLLVATVLHRARGFLTRRRVRRTLDATTGVALLAFSARLATD